MAVQFVFMSSGVATRKRTPPALPPSCTSPHLRKKQKVSKNTGDWNTLSPATQERYCFGVPSPDPIIRSFEEASSAGEKLECDFSLITQQLFSLEASSGK